MAVSTSLYVSLPHVTNRVVSCSNILIGSFLVSVDMNFQIFFRLVTSMLCSVYCKVSALDAF